MKKLDYEVREFHYKEELAKEELKELINIMRKQGFDYEANSKDTTWCYSFIKFNRTI